MSWNPNKQLREWRSSAPTTQPAPGNPHPAVTENHTGRPTFDKNAYRRAPAPAPGRGSTPTASQVPSARQSPAALTTKHAPENPRQAVTGNNAGRNDRVLLDKPAMPTAHPDEGRFQPGGFDARTKESDHRAGSTVEFSQRRDDEEWQRAMAKSMPLPWKTHDYRREGSPRQEAESAKRDYEGGSVPPSPLRYDPTGRMAGGPPSTKNPKPGTKRFDVETDVSHRVVCLEEGRSRRSNRRSVTGSILIVYAVGLLRSHQSYQHNGVLNSLMILEGPWMRYDDAFYEARVPYSQAR
ncbi:hypothetical protein DL764_007001 [Monosporascus ibericus]|uniref:Uncharacterized protein n=1 Tax=Monosporascus ibericus TaxID=155417 RepID=A0A4Q4T6H8_9PEZI|nr:hypothetical protein DL764_007001 [Monosporascus ibericus]